jgi:hypothetical protein
MKPSTQSVLKQAEKWALQLLEDTVTISHPSVDPTDVVDGIPEFDTFYYTYKGSRDIPCRLDVSRAQRAESVDHQEAVASEFVIHLPKHLDDELLLRPNDQIVLTDRGGRERHFEMKKASDFEAWGITSEYYVTEIEFQHG